MSRAVRRRCESHGIIIFAGNGILMFLVSCVYVLEVRQITTNSRALQRIYNHP